MGARLRGRRAVPFAQLNITSATESASAAVTFTGSTTGLTVPAPSTYALNVATVTRR